PRKSSRSASIASSVRAPRSPGATPTASKSFPPSPPTPTPSTTRPPERESRDERRVPQRQQHDARADADALGASGEAGERNGHVEDGIVEGDVVACPQRLVADRLRELRHRPEEARVGRAADELPRPLEAEADRRPPEAHACSATRIA